MNKIDVLRVAKECGMHEFPAGQWTTYGNISSVETGELERFAEAMIAVGAEGMRERAAIAANGFKIQTFAGDNVYAQAVIRALPVAQANKERT